MTRGNRTSRRRRRFWIILSLFVVTTAMVPLSYIAAPHIVRYQNAARLTSDDLAMRERGLNFLIRRGPDDPRVAAAAIDRLEVEDQTNFIQIVSALDQAALWQADRVTPEAWLRWLSILAQDSDPEARIIASQNVATLHRLVGHPDMEALLDRLQSDENADVRYNTLIAVGRLWGRTERQIELLPRLIHFAQDAQETVAQHAWVLIGQTRTFAAARDHATISSAPEPVAMTMLYAATMSDPSNCRVALDAFQASRTRDSVRAFAAYCLGITRDERGAEALYELLKSADLGGIHEHQRLLYQRAWLGITPVQAGQLTLSTGNWSGQQLLEHAADKPWFEPIIHAVSYRTGQPFLFQSGEGQIDSDYTQRDALTFLAACEGRTVGQLPVPVSAYAPDLLQLAVLAKTPRPTADDFAGPMRSAVPAIRDLACRIAADRLDDEQLVSRLREALTSFHDAEKMSGAILAGLTGLRPRQLDAQPGAPDLLQYRYSVEDVWAVKQVMGLGLWMQGRNHELKRSVTSLLARDDLPRSTVILAMLHQSHPDTWRALYRPMTEDAPIDLYELLVNQRWWHVLEPYTDAPTDNLWLWADVELQAFQIETLRSRRLIHPDFVTRSQSQSFPASTNTSRLELNNESQ